MAYEGTPAESATERLAAVTAKQRAVSDPSVSAWVSANAGSGKTHVLIQRVTRLLLAGTAPSTIVCITYTKAAAAEMADRLFRQLGGWALLPDQPLRAELSKVVGDEEAAGADLAGARRLFARALETPGGLKIQTIHAFCEVVLRRFPSEAGLLPGFDVMEEKDAKAAMDEIVSRLAERALAEDPVLLEAFDALGGTYKPSAGGGLGFHTGLQDLLSAFAGKRLAIAKAHAEAGGVDGFCRALHGRHGLTGEESEAQIREAACRDVDVLFLRQVVDAFAVGGKRAADTSEQIAAFLGAERRCFDALTTIALTTALEPRQPKWWGKKSYDRVTDFEDRWAELAESVRSAHEALESLAFCRLNTSLHRLGAEVIDAYEARKARLGLLDFEDLIDRTARLLRDTSNAWVLYKLDQGISHVLLDEAQDTAAAQWEVVQALTEEFFSGRGIEQERPRTLFVVGDEKQSIYSFQGADAALFEAKLAETTGLIERDQFRSLPFGLSFRTTEPVLRFVDEALRNEGEGGRSLLGIGYERHTSRFPGLSGAVEVWPLPEKGDKPKGEAWDTPVDLPAPNDPQRQLADAICERIKRWTRDGEEPLGNPSRPVRPGDVLILCQRRSAQFHEIVRALSRHGIPAAGADKVRMKDDVAVRDLLALLRFASNKGDCLSLAELLRSPFWDVTEDELFELAHGRKGRLRGAVLRRAAGDDALAAKCRWAAEEIEAAIAEGRRAGAFAMLSGLLERGRPTGRQRIARRLGTVPDEAIEELLAEALDFESRHPRTIEGFLAHLERFDGEVKKEQGKEAGPGAVRVMTVHGAKGLEAPIVFLADAAYCKAAGDALNRNPLVSLGTMDAGGFAPDAGHLVCWPGGPDKGPEPIRLAKAHAEERRLEEYRRLFYVAATRAAERLYVCGVDGRRDPDAPDSAADWHALSERAVRRMGCEAIDTPLGTVLRYEAGTAASAEEAMSAEDAAYPVPAWLTSIVPTERSAPIVIPSSGAVLPDEADMALGDDGEDPAYPPSVPGKVREPYRRGNALHRLLERLPDVPPDQRRDVGRALLRGMAPTETEAEAWLDETLPLLVDPRFASVFAPGSMAEVPVAGRIGDHVVSGQVDRLLVTEDEVVIVDFKSNRPPPSDPSGVSDRVLFQLAAYEALLSRIYPNRPVRTALLWTYAPRLMPIPSEMLVGRLG